MNIVYFLLLLGMGFVCLIYFKWITDNTMRIDFAEKYFGRAGTYTLWKLVGVGLIIASFYILFQ
ncbi:MAG: hypothetical protein WC107_06950 [Patescibacteria group bacterium]